MHNFKRSRCRLTVQPPCAALVITFLLSAGLCAQSGEPDRDEGEFSVYSGAAFGPLGGHATVGGSAGVFFSKYAGVLVEGNYIPMDTRTLVRHLLLTRSSRLFDFAFTTHIQIPIKHRWSPYGLLSADLLYNPYQIQRIGPSDVIFFQGTDNVKFGVSAGAGTRYFIREDFGIRGEYRYTVSTQNFSRLLFGIFYRLPSTWP